MYSNKEVMLNIIMNFETVEGTLLFIGLFVFLLIVFLPIFILLHKLEKEEKRYKKYLEEKLKNSEPISTGVTVNNMFPHIALMNTTVFTTL